MNDVYEYYLWMSQGNTFAPKFDDLTDDCKCKWVERFESYQQSQLNI